MRQEERKKKGRWDREKGKDVSGLRRVGRDGCVGVRRSLCSRLTPTYGFVRINRGEKKCLKVVEAFFHERKRQLNSSFQLREARFVFLVIFCNQHVD